MEILVTGGLGFVGRAVVGALLRANHGVTVLTRRPVAGLACGTVTLLQGDLTLADGMARLLSERRFDGICHLAGLTGVRDSFARPTAYFETNIGGTVNLLKAIRTWHDRTGAATRVVFASSRAVYADTADRPVPETFPAVPTTPYGVTKRASEQLLQFESLLGRAGVVSLRCFNISGGAPGIVDSDTQRLIPRLVQAVAGNLPPPLLGSRAARIDLVHVNDVGSAFASAFDHAKPGESRVYNVASGTTTSVGEVIALLEQAAGRVVPLASGSAVTGSSYGAVTADISQIRKDLGWDPTRDVQAIVNDAWTFAEEGSSKGNGLHA